MIKLGDKSVDFRLGDTAVPKIYRGDEVVWSRKVVHFQQLSYPYEPSSTNKGVKFEKRGDGGWYVHGTPTGTNVFGRVDYNSGAMYSHRRGDIYLIYGNIIGTPSTQCVIWTPLTASTSSGFITKDGAIITVDKASSDSYCRHQINRNDDEAVFETVDYIIYPMVFNLTTMFVDCPELMPTTVAEFKQMFPETYYPYTSEPYDVYI